MNYRYLISYLSELLTNRKHFNISDELQLANIEKRKNNLKQLLNNNPFEIDNIDIDLLVKLDTTIKSNIENIKDEPFKEILLFEINLMNDYIMLWNEQRKKDFKNTRGRNREELHKELFKQYFLNHLKQNNLSINEELNICYLDQEVLFPTTLSEILDNIDSLHENSKALFFRGHNNSSYRLMPSIYRGNAPFYEKEIFYDTISTIPHEVTGINSAFEILTKFQHFGTPTRLLDITTNPLVALFFACKNSNKNGELLTFSVDRKEIKLFDSDTVSVVTNIVKLPYNFTLPTTLKPIGDNHFKELVHKVRNEKPYFDNLVVSSDLKRSFFVKPKLDNPRLIKQSGAFIVCGMDDIKYKPSNEIFDIEKYKVIKRMMIRKSIKRKILKSLETFNISSGSLFPELSDVANYVKSQYGVK